MLGCSRDNKAATTKLQRQGPVVGFDRDGLGDEEIARVDALVDEMPGDPVRGSAVEKRTDRGIQPRVARQGAVMEVHDSATRMLEKPGRQDPDVEDAEQPVARLLPEDLEIGIDVEGGQAEQATLAGKGLARGQAADDLETRVDQPAQAMRSDHRIADQRDSGPSLHRSFHGLNRSRER